MSETPSASAHLFAPPSHPKIKAISRNAIQDFLAERAQYEVSIEAQHGLKPVSWAGCFDALFLRSLLKGRIFGAQNTTIEQLSDNVIKARLESLASATKHVSFDEAMVDVKRNIRLDASEPDARLRVLMLQTSYVSLCEKRGWNKLTKHRRLL